MKKSILSILLGLFLVTLVSGCYNGGNGGNGGGDGGWWHHRDKPTLQVNIH